MMKKLSFLLVAFSMATMLTGQEQLSTRQQEVQQTVIKMFEALSNRDSVSLKKYCTADIALYEYGQAWNIDTLILKAIIQNKATDFARTNSFDFINTTIDRNTAWVTYHLNSTIARDGKQGFAHWMETVVLVKEKNRWKIKLLHSTLIKRS